MRLLPLIGLLCLATPALAQPAPAGSCRLEQGLVAQVPPPMRPGDASPSVVSMALPKMGLAVADISLHISADGAARDVKFLCVSSHDAKLEDALKKASAEWKFRPMMQGGKATGADARYRLSAAGITPLSFLPEKLRPIEG
jgi:hypothetical protein